MDTLDANADGALNLAGFLKLLAEEGRAVVAPVPFPDGGDAEALAVLRGVQKITRVEITGQKPIGVCATFGPGCFALLAIGTGRGGARRSGDRGALFGLAVEAESIPRSGGGWRVRGSDAVTEGVGEIRLLPAVAWCCARRRGRRSATSLPAEQCAALREAFRAFAVILPVS